MPKLKERITLPLPSAAFSFAVYVGHDVLGASLGTAKHLLHSSLSRLETCMPLAMRVGKAMGACSLSSTPLGI